jgi:hypothetical protein
VDPKTIAHQDLGRCPSELGRHPAAVATDDDPLVSGAILVCEELQGQASGRASDRGLIHSARSTAELTP